MQLPAMSARARPRLSDSLLCSTDSPVFYYQLTSKNDSRAVSPEPRKFTYHSDLHLPPAVLVAALQRVVEVNGDPARYRFASFAY